RTSDTSREAKPRPRASGSTITMQTQARSRPYPTAPAVPTTRPPTSAARKTEGGSRRARQSASVWFQPMRRHSVRLAGTSAAVRSRKLASPARPSPLAGEDEVAEHLRHVEALARRLRPRGLDGVLLWRLRPARPLDAEDIEAPGVARLRGQRHRLRRRKRAERRPRDERGGGPARGLAARVLVRPDLRHEPLEVPREVHLLVRP